MTENSSGVDSNLPECDICTAGSSCQEAQVFSLKDFGLELCMDCYEKAVKCPTCRLVHFQDETDSEYCFDCIDLPKRRLT